MPEDNEHYDAVVLGNVLLLDLLPKARIAQGLSPQAENRAQPTGLSQIQREGGFDVRSRHPEQGL
ncbi:hypothetical protein LWC34_04545 [Kibdelosporangium philippinense]|uniref:Uncharacterized protein n=1 Tax=Kibdelosporangium philippinense TaxID=211113 RepID=A0ABS8Z8E1_9PSEU|nr:hypothetical protein [Kibdelosporangium philippinense]MCE7002097.1 hypothetical protein [Kibdelosporangium philippinense]